MTNELIAKAKACKSADELLALAKENNMEMTAEEAAENYAILNNEGELSDDELSGASGGGCKNEKKYNHPEPGDVCKRIDGEGCYKCGCKYFHYRGSIGTGQGTAQYNFWCVNCGTLNKHIATGELNPLCEYEEVN